MALNTTPVFETPTNTIGVATLAAANTARDGSGTITTLHTGSANGTRIDMIRFISAQATAAASASKVGRVFISSDGGTTWTLFDEVAITGTTSSTTAVGDKNEIIYSSGIILPSTSYKIGVTISVYGGVQDRVSVISRGGDLGQ